MEIIYLGITIITNVRVFFFIICTFVASALLEACVDDNLFRK